MITILCEKRSAATNFATALGGFTGELNGDTYQIVWSMGHLFEMLPIDEMVPREDIPSYTSWDIDVLPFDRKKIKWGISLKPDVDATGTKRDYSGRLAAIASALSKSHTCIIATDVDVSGEGDLLAWEILKHLQFNGTVYRCKHQDESVTNIKKAMTPVNLVKIDATDGALQRGLARQRFDFLTIQYSRVTTTTGRTRQVLPYNITTREGRLKTAMISLIGSSEYAHLMFKPHSRFTSSYIDADGHVFIKEKSPEFDEKSEAERLVSSMAPSTIQEPAGPRRSKRQPPQLFDISTVSSRLSKMGFSSETLINVAQKMYQDSIISYPRTDDNQITTEQLKQMIPLVPQIATVVGVDVDMLDINGFRKAMISDTDLPHGANRPGLTVPVSMDAIKNAYGEIGAVLYDVLARSFLAQFAADAEYETRTFTDESGEYKYSVTSNVSRGYELVLNPNLAANTLVDKHGDIIDLDTLSDDERQKVLTDQRLPVIGAALQPNVKEKKAKRPAKATETTLMRYLKTNNIGTGATRVQTFVDISVKRKGQKIDRRLVEVDKKGSITLTPAGQVSFLLMKGTLLAEPGVTKELDNRLKKVANGEMTIEEILLTFDQMFVKDKKIIIENSGRLSSLPKTQAKQVVREKVTGTFTPTGQTVSFSDTWSNHKFTNDEIAQLLDGKEISFKLPIDNKKSMDDLKGDTDQMCTVYGVLRDDGDKYGFGFKQTRREYPQRASFTGVYLPTGEEITFSAKFGQYTLSKEEADKLLTGETISFTAPKKAGGTYTAVVKLAYADKWGSKTGEKIWQMVFANN